MSSNSVDSTKESAGERFFQPFMIACAKAWVVSKVLGFTLASFRNGFLQNCGHVLIRNWEPMY